MINSKIDYRILHVEDLASDAGLAEREIGKYLNSYTIEVVETEEDFINALEVFNPHIVISDFMLPAFDGMRALKISLEKAPDIPVIILTGSMNEDTAVSCIKAGATDYVIKEHIKRLGPALINALEQKEVKLEKKKALQQIELLSKSIEKSPVIVVITDPKGNLEYVNPKFSELTGYNEHEVLGENMNILKSGKQSSGFYDDMWETIQSGKDWKGELQNKRKNGELYWESVAISSIADPKGEITHYIGIKEDITGKKQLFEELIVSKNKAEESDQLKTAFLHNISHEIRTPMNAIEGFSNLLNNASLSSEKKKRFTDIIINSSHQLLSIINDIVNISTIEVGQEKIYENEINLNLEVRNLYDQFTIMAQKQNISLQYDVELLDEEDCTIVDKTKLFEVLSNLINNAIKFTSEGLVKFGYKVKGNNIEFYVKDTGIGILNEMQTEIFKRFRQVETTSTREFGGSGLGLSISKAYVELMGGEIWINSELGVGSTFYFTIPYKKNVSKNVSVKSETELNIEFKNAPFILIAEDEDSNFMLLEEFLSDINVNVIRAINGIEAIAICKSEQAVDLVLMDIKMPLMNGYEATKQIKEFKPNLPIIALTAYTASSDKQKAMACGCVDFLSKPIDQNLLFTKINEQVNELRRN